jgi:hypothetical protein
LYYFCCPDQDAAIAESQYDNEKKPAIILLKKNRDK